MANPTHKHGHEHSGAHGGHHHHDDHHGHDAHELGFWKKYVFSIDHKVIGIQYGVTALCFLFFGFSLIMLMRYQLAYPGSALALGGWLFPKGMPDGIMLPEFYNSLGAMHGTIMVFLGVVPLLVGAFGNYVMPRVFSFKGGPPIPDGLLMRRCR